MIASSVSADSDIVNFASYLMHFICDILIWDAKFCNIVYLKVSYVLGSLIAIYKGENSVILAIGDPYVGSNVENIVIFNI